jgi:hypothetical protein
MGDVKRVVGKIGAAAATDGRVGGVRQRVEPVPRLVHAEADAVGPQAVGDRDERRVVAVYDDGRALVELRQHRAPGAGDGVELTVAIELVAEEVVQQHDARARAADELRQGRLVGLDDADLAARRAGQRRAGDEGADDAADEVRPRAVMNDRMARFLEDVRNHAGGRCLAVGAGDDHRAMI